MAVAAPQTSVAAPAPAPQRTPVRRRRPRQQRGVLGGVLWIAVLAALLAGVVALNVAVLGLNLELDRLSRERAQLHATTAQLESRLSSAGAPPRIGTVAQKRLRLVQATPEQTTYVHLGK